MSKINHLNTISEFREACRKKVPKVAFEYLESGTEKEKVIARNESQFDSIEFIPKFCLGKKEVPTLTTSIFNNDFNAPIGIAPIGLTGLIWPNAEKYLARVAKQFQIPFCLSTVATASPEEINEIHGIDNKLKWFQLYPPKDIEILDSLLERARDSGFSKLVVTVDIPAPSRRERSKSAGLQMPLKFSLRLIIDGLTHPKWLISTLVKGLPKLRTVESYTNNNSLRFVSNFVGNRLGGTVDWDYIKLLRSKWNGPLIIKGILHPDDALKAKEAGVDGVYISNHGGRQFDAVVTPLEQLTKIREVVGQDFPLLFDSGIRSGLDVMKAIYAGADFVLVGRPFMYGIGSFQEEGAKQIFEILSDQLRNNMMQMGLETVGEIKTIPEDMINRKFNI